MNQNYAIILAAGQGTRIKSKSPKVLHKVCGKEMINHVIDTLRIANIQDINVIVGKGADLVIKATKNRHVSYSHQMEQLGTGHAVKCATEFLKDKKGTVAVFCGDAPTITPETIEKLFNIHNQNNNSITLLTSILDDASGYGRIVRDGESVLKIVEHKDCTADELKIKEMNAGVYCFDIKNLLDSLNQLSNNNAQGEYYLTDVIGIQKQQNYKVGAIVVDFEETKGVNSRVQLAEVESILKNRINKKHMDNGVTLIDPNSTYIGADVVIGQDTVIYPNNIIEGHSVIGEDCILYQNNRIHSSVIANGTTIESSVITDSSIGSDTTIGPFAYIRPESQIGNNVRIGDFVEIKKSSIGNNTKVSHLTYIGDATVGSKCNFGCGTVVVNYDGKSKHHTTIGDNCFIGCNTNLVSPVILEDNCYTAAGSTITNDVNSGDLAIARAKQCNIEGWVKSKGLLKNQ